MSRTMRYLAALAATMLIAAPVAAQEIEPIAIESVRDRPVVTLDPSRAYLLIEGQNMGISHWIAMPDAAMREDWERQRQEALAEEVASYPRRLERYERAYTIWSSRRDRNVEPTRPIEPRDETFAWPAIEQARIISIGPQNRFASESGHSLWLYAVPEGEYVFYGLGIPNFIECACLGTVAFTTEVGRVTAVRMGQTWLDAQGNPIDDHPDGLSSTDRSVRLSLFVEPPSERAFDPRIAREMLRIPEFRVVESVPNWLGSTITRVQPIPGIIDYERGRAIDPREADPAGSSVANGTGQPTASAAIAETPAGEGHTANIED